MTTKPSNKVFATGSQRDSQEGKPRPDIISPYFLWQLGERCELGERKYGPRNWEKGQPLHQLYASMFRHMTQWAMGFTDENHAAAASWNWMAIIHITELCLSGKLPEQLLTAGPYAKYTEEDYIEWEKEGTHEFKLEIPDDTDDIIITTDYELFITNPFSTNR